MLQLWKLLRKIAPHKPMRVKYSHWPLSTNQSIQVLVLTIAAHCRDLFLQVLQANLSKYPQLPLTQSRELQISRLERTVRSPQKRNQKLRGDRVPKGANDPVALHNIFGALEDIDFGHLRPPHAFVAFRRENKKGRYLPFNTLSKNQSSYLFPMELSKIYELSLLIQTHCPLVLCSQGNRQNEY